jgi:formylglycine-generating enzyme required for sulfatase activity
MPPANPDSTDGMVELPGGEFLMGNAGPHSYPDDGEGPTRRVRIDPFWIDACAVSNAGFSQFIEATGHVTDGERFGWSFVFAGLLPDDFPPTRGVTHAPWWRRPEKGRQKSTLRRKALPLRRRLARARIFRAADQGVNVSSLERS